MEQPFKLKSALVLTGGGARAAYQVGALRALAEIFPGKSNPFPIVAGTSAGAINAGFLAARAEDWDAAIDRLNELWLNLELEDVYRTGGLSLTRIAWAWMTRTLFGGFRKKHNDANFLLDTTPLKELLDREIDFNEVQKCLASGVLSGLCFSALDYANSQTVSFFQDHGTHEPWLRSGRVGKRTVLNTNHILASAAIPIFFPPVRIGERFFGDGSLRQIAPLSPAIHLGADRILAISIRYEKAPEPELENHPVHAPSLAEIGGELMHSLFLDSLDADLERLTRMNEGAASFPASRLKKIPVLVLKPSRNLEEMIPNLLSKFPVTLRFLLRGLGVSNHQGNGLMSYLAFLPECIQPLIRLGYEDTLLRREEILKFMEGSFPTTDQSGFRAQ